MPIVNISQIQGKWVRTESNKPVYDSLKVEVVNTAGFITSLGNNSTNGSFQLNQTKWKDIKADRDNIFTYKELGSDGNYYNAEMELVNSNISNQKYLIIKVNQSGTYNGNSQLWEMLP